MHDADLRHSGEGVLDVEDNCVCIFPSLIRGREASRNSRC